MSESPKPSAIQGIAKTLETAAQLQAIPANQRPAYPAIVDPTAGGILFPASSTSTTLITVSVSTNRPDRLHKVDLLNADTLASVDGDKTVNFSTNPGLASVEIPILTTPDVVSFVIQCRVPGDPAGNVHRILVDAQAPIIPTPPSISMLNAADAVGVAVPFNPDHTVNSPNLTNVVVTADILGGTPPYAFMWSIFRITSSGFTTSLDPHNANNLPIDLINGETVFPIAVSITCQVTDNFGMNSVASPPFTITIN